MALRLIEIIAPKGFLDTIEAAADCPAVIEKTVLTPADERTRPSSTSSRGRKGASTCSTNLQRVLGSAEDWRISLLPVEISLPEKPLPEEDASAFEREQTSATREELVNSVSRGGGADGRFLPDDGIGRDRGRGRTDRRQHRRRHRRHGDRAAALAQYRTGAGGGHGQRNAGAARRAGAGRRHRAVGSAGLWPGLRAGRRAPTHELLLAHIGGAGKRIAGAGFGRGGGALHHFAARRRRWSA